MLYIKQEIAEIKDGRTEPTRGSENNKHYMKIIRIRIVVSARLRKTLSFFW